MLWEKAVAGLVAISRSQADTLLKASSAGELGYLVAKQMEPFVAKSSLDPC